MPGTHACRVPTHGDAWFAPHVTELSADAKGSVERYATFSTSTAFRPPKAKELDMAYSTCWWRATLGITSRLHSGSGSLKLAVGGSTPSRSAITVARHSSAAAAPSAW